MLVWTPIDRNLLFCEDMTLSASDVVASGGNDVILDIGAGRADFGLVVDVSEIEIASNNELYSFVLQGSNSSTFANGIENLAILQLGATEVRLGGADDSTVGRYVVFGSTDPLTDYRYVRLNVIISGTIATGITFSAWLIPLPA